MSALIHTVFSTIGSFVLAPILLLLCTLLFPFAFFTTYLAFVALSVRAALVQAQVAGALFRHWLGIDGDSMSTSAWVPKDIQANFEDNSVQYILKGKSMVSKHLRTASIDANGHLLATETSHTQLEGLPTKDFAPFSTTSGTVPPASPTTSRPGSNHSSHLARDYEGIGGWYTLPANSASKPDTPSSLEWLHMNARLELPDADASSLTRPRTPEERNRSLSIGGRSHRSTVSLHRRHHQRTTTAGSIEVDQLGEMYPIESGIPRGSDLRERSLSGILFRSQKSLSDVAASGGKKIGESKHKSMILLGEKGSRFAYRLAGWKPLSLKKKSKNESIGSPEESAGEDLSFQNRSKGPTQPSDSSRQVNTVSGTTTPVVSAPGSVEGVETGNDLTMWMSP